MCLRRKAIHALEDMGRMCTGVLLTLLSSRLARLFNLKLVSKDEDGSWHEDSGIAHNNHSIICQAARQKMHSVPGRDAHLRSRL